MKAIVIFFLFGFAAFFINLGCCPSALNGCCTIDCPHDEKTPPLIEAIFPFKVGDHLRYVSNEYDTLDFNCTSREYFETVESPGGNAEMECCDAVTKEGFTCSFDSPTNATLTISDSNWGYPTITSTVSIGNDQINGVWVFVYFPEYDMNLAGKDFDNISVGNKDSTIFMNKADTLGIVGFKIAGKEWRKL